MKKQFRKIRRFFLNLKIKKKDSSEYGQSETAAILDIMLLVTRCTVGGVSYDKK